MPKVTKGQFEAAFGRAAEAAGAVPKESDEKDPRVQELWALIEPALEEKGRFESEIRSYISENTNDITSWRRARFWAMLFAIAVVALTLLSLILILFCPWSPLKLFDLMPNVQIALLTGHFAVIVGLTAIIMRGAFAPSRREETGLALPESGKLALETLRGIMGHPQ